MNPRTTSRASLLRRRLRWTTMTMTSTRKSTPQVRRRADVLTLSIIRRRLLHRRHRRLRHRLLPSLLPVRRPFHRRHPHRPSAFIWTLSTSISASPVPATFTAYDFRAQSSETDGRRTANGATISEYAGADATAITTISAAPTPLFIASVIWCGKA